MSGRLRALTLAVTSAVTAEFLLGDQYLQGLTAVGQQAIMLVLYTVFYGSAAVLIREVARRTGRGWPTILLLALAFGLLEEGVVDQTLFNPNFLGHRLLDYGHIPVIGTAGPWLVFVLSLHVIWSIGAPIAVAEALSPQPLAHRPPVRAQVQGPWLGRWGIGLCVLGLLAGGIAIFFATVVAVHFMASVLQLTVAIAVAGAAVLVALRLRPMPARPAANPLPAAVVALVLTSAFHLAEGRIPRTVPAALAVLVLLVILAVGVLCVVRWRLDTFGLAAGAVLTYCWLGLTKTAGLPAAALVEQCVLVLIALGVLALAWRRHGRHVRVVS